MEFDDAQHTGSKKKKNDKCIVLFLKFQLRKQKFNKMCMCMCVLSL